MAKLAAERYCVSFSRVYESFESVVLRYFNVFGPRQSPFSQYAAVGAALHHEDRRRRADRVYGDGEQSRDFTYVGNVVDATIRAGDAEGANGEIFNVAAGSPASVNRVADTIGAISASRSQRRELPTRPGDIRDSWADLGKPQRILGYRPSVDLRRACGARSRLLASERIKVLRVIARLNVGGPALHVAYLTAGPRRARLRHDARRRHARPRRGVHGARRGERGVSIVALDAPAPRDLAAQRPARRSSSSPR